jgi:hypothetical protein
VYLSEELARDVDEIDAELPELPIGYVDDERVRLASLPELNAYQRAWILDLRNSIPEIRAAIRASRWRKRAPAVEAAPEKPKRPALPPLAPGETRCRRCPRAACDGRKTCQRCRDQLATAKARLRAKQTPAGSPMSGVSAI